MYEFCNRYVCTVLLLYTTAIRIVHVSFHIHTDKYKYLCLLRMKLTLVMLGPYIRFNQCSIQIQNATEVNTIVSDM